MEMQCIITAAVGKKITCLLVDDLSIKYNTVHEHAFSVVLNNYIYSLIYFF